MTSARSSYAPAFQRISFLPGTGARPPCVIPPHTILRLTASHADAPQVTTHKAELTSPWQLRRGMNRSGRPQGWTHCYHTVAAAMRA